MSFGGHLTLDLHPPGSDDLAFWADLAATFRDKFGDMVCYPALYSQRITDIDTLNSLLLQHKPASTSLTSKSWTPRPPRGQFLSPFLRATSLSAQNELLLDPGSMMIKLQWESLRLITMGKHL